MTGSTRLQRSRIVLPARMVNSGLALRSDERVEVGILGGDVVVRRAGGLAGVDAAGVLPAGGAGVLLVAQRRVSMAPLWIEQLSAAGCA